MLGKIIYQDYEDSKQKGKQMKWVAVFYYEDGVYDHEIFEAETEELAEDHVRMGLFEDFDPEIDRLPWVQLAPNPKSLPVDEWIKEFVEDNEKEKADQKEREERELLAELKAKYEGKETKKKGGESSGANRKK
jgi:hypothetical protein